MGSINYIPLRTTSQYSLLEGAMQIESIVNKAINHKIPAIGLTDRNNLFGALEFSEKLIEKGIQPIICLLYTSPSPRDQRGSRMPSSA